MAGGRRPQSVTFTVNFTVNSPQPYTVQSSISERRLSMQHRKAVSVRENRDRTRLIIVITGVDLKLTEGEEEGQARRKPLNNQVVRA